MRPRADTLLVWTGGDCTYGCAACPIDRRRERPGLTAAEVRRALEGVPSDPQRLVVLVGGEPFLRPDIYHLLAAIRAAGFAAGLVTTGRPLVYKSARTNLRRVGLAYLRVQLFGIGDAHDRATAVPGGFAQALDALRAWSRDPGEGCDVDLAVSARGAGADPAAIDLEPLARQIRDPRVQVVGGDGPFPGAGFIGAPAVASCLGRTNAQASSEGTTCANAFNFVDSGVSCPTSRDWTTCTAFSSAPPGEPLRQLWLVDGDRLRLYATDTADFTTAEIVRIKEEWSHVFVDRAPPGVLDDFTEGMRRVWPDPACGPCRHRATCGRRYLVVEGPPFADEEAWIAAHVGNLQGRVLDVGCGEQLYLDRLAPRVRSGAVDYTGLDPDQPSLDRLHRALPEGHYHLTGIEEFRGGGAPYDHILCLRSLNHVVDVDTAFARMAALLVAGGRLLIVENTPFALLRRAEQVAAADRAPRAGHQHFRNVASEQVLPLAKRHGFHVLHHHPVGLERSNEWILLLHRR